jgi:uncharacterized membrane protein
MRFCIVFVWLVGCGVAASGADASIDGGPGSGATCPADSTLTYDSFAQDFFTAYCVRCHASTNVGAARNGAPVGYDWDVLASVRAHAAQMDRQAAIGSNRANRFMPPNGTMPSDDERRQLGEWLACGAP